MLKKNTTEVGIIIANARKEKGISQRELARLSNMDCAEVSRIEAGKRLKPNVLYLKGIANALDLSLLDLMKKAGYSDIEMNFGRDLTDKRSNKDYENYIEDYERFYFDILEEIENRRKNAFACKGIIAELIDKIELSKIEKKEISIDYIYDNLKDLLSMIRPNLEKVDKSIYPKHDPAMHKLPSVNSNLKIDFTTGKFMDK